MDPSPKYFKRISYLHVFDYVDFNLISNQIKGGGGAGTNKIGRWMAQTDHFSHFFPNKSVKMKK